MIGTYVSTKYILMPFFAHSEMRRGAVVAVIAWKLDLQLHMQ